MVGTGRLAVTVQSGAVALLRGTTWHADGCSASGTRLVIQRRPVCHLLPSAAVVLTQTTGFSLSRRINR